MSQSFLVTNTQTGNFEDLVNYIYKISYAQAPFMNTIGSVKAKAITHEWMTQALRSGASNEQAEGFTPTFAAANQTVRVRRTNRVQIIADEYSVSNTQEFVDKAGLGTSSEYDEQASLRELEVMKDADYELINSTAVARDADAGTAGEMDGALAWAPSSGGFRIAAAGGQLTQDLWEGLSRIIYEASGEAADLLVVPGIQRRKISTWTTNYKEVNHKDTTFVDTVEVYRGDYGSQTVLHDLHVPADTLLACKKEFMKKAFLRPVKHYELGQTIDGRRGYVVMEVTLEARNPNTVGRITGLA
jgi:hypothetical protein